MENFYSLKIKLYFIYNNFILLFLFDLFFDTDHILIDYENALHTFNNLKNATRRDKRICLT